MDIVATTYRILSKIPEINIYDFFGSESSNL